MANTVWKSFNDALVDIMGSDINNARHVRLKDHKECRDKCKAKRKIYDEIITEIDTEKVGKINDYIESILDRDSQMQKESYCQGYLDCIQLLTGLGLLDAFKEDEIVRRIIE